jgi:hypothetical protein
MGGAVSKGELDAAAASAKGRAGAGAISPSIEAGACDSRDPQIAAAPRAPHTTMLVANILIREGFFQVPRMLRGTSNS